MKFQAQSIGLQKSSHITALGGHYAEEDLLESRIEEDVKINKIK